MDLEPFCERLGYTRIWVAEHHGMPNIACSAPEILIEHVASATELSSRTFWNFVREFSSF